MALQALKERIDTIESAYEFFLAYAAQGLRTHQGSKSGGEMRARVEGFVVAVDGLAEAFRELEGAEEKAPGLTGFLDVLEADERASLAALRLVQGQGAISSQLVDNFNASIHVRALLTDVFLIDEILKVLGDATPAADAPVEEPL